MKYTQSFLWGICLCILLSACTTDNKTVEEDEFIDEATEQKVEDMMESAQAKIEENPVPDMPRPVEPPPSKEKEENEAQAKEDSIFSKEDCCTQEGQSTSECCCEKVVKKYGGYVTLFYETGDEEMGEKVKDMRTGDPYLGNCTKIAKWRAAVDAIENPED